MSRDEFKAIREQIDALMRATGGRKRSEEWTYQGHHFLKYVLTWKVPVTEASTDEKPVVQVVS